MGKQRLIVITGPTATGKTALGALLAESINGEVVSADSMQVYKYMDVGTAKPTVTEKQGVPHHMLDVAAPWEDYSVARYVTDASRCVDDILQRGKLPVIVGGTGLYIDSLISGREFSDRGDGALRGELEKEYDTLGGAAMLRKLRGFDPESASKLFANDKKRIVRAFEVYKTTGKTISQHDAETRGIPPRYNAVKYALTFAERAVLYSRIDARADKMIADGLGDEVRGLLDMGLKPGSTAMQAIGYKEIAGVILGCYDMDAAVAQIKKESRRYAKRQLTWLRRDTRVHWITWEKEPDFARLKREVYHTES